MARPQSGNKLLKLATLFAVLAVSGLLWVNRQSLFDWARLRGYNPPADITALASRTTMVGSAKRLFYVQHPQLENKTQFNRHCVTGELTIVLGCYISGQQHIYLLEVTDKRLSGVQEVTAAHEMLHAAYDRLDGADKSRVNQLIMQAYAKVNDKRIIDTINAYKKAGADTTNELHSILGTEVKNLPPELESYYKVYFTNRSKIVSFSQHYQLAFNSRKDKASALLSDIKDLESRLKNIQALISSSENRLLTERQNLEQERQTTNDAANFNAQVDAYNTEVAQYKNLINTYNQLVAQHNRLVSQYQAVTFEENELVKALDSRSTSVQTQ